MRVIQTKIVATVSIALALSAFATESAAGETGVHVFDMGMKPILESYLKAQQALAADSIGGVQTAAKSIATHAAKLDAKSVKGEHAEHYKHLPMKLEKAAKVLNKATTIEATREAFKQLSKPMAAWGTMSKPEGVDVLFCSMAKASWLQKQGDVKNPYLGASMLGCGEIVGGAGHAMKGMEQGDHGKH